MKLTHLLLTMTYWQVVDRYSRFSNLSIKVNFSQCHIIFSCRWLCLPIVHSTSLRGLTSNRWPPLFLLSHLTLKLKGISQHRGPHAGRLGLPWYGVSKRDLDFILSNCRYLKIIRMHCLIRLDLDIWEQSISQVKETWRKEGQLWSWLHNEGKVSKNLMASTLGIQVWLFSIFQLSAKL